MNVVIIDNGSRHIDRIAELFDDATVSKMALHDPAIHDIPTDTLVVLSGGRWMSVLKHQQEYANELEFIRSFGGAIIGICLGFELIAHAYGNQLYKMDERREGIHPIRALESGEAVLGGATAQVYQGHKWFVKEVGAPLEALAESDDGVELLRHTSRKIYATQFHPEVHDGNDGREIFRRIMDDITAAD